MIDLLQGLLRAQKILRKHHYVHVVAGTFELFTQLFEHFLHISCSIELITPILLKVSIGVANFGQK